MRLTPQPVVGLISAIFPTPQSLQVSCLAAPTLLVVGSRRGCCLQHLQCWPVLLRNRWTPLLEQWAFRPCFAAHDTKTKHYCLKGGTNPDLEAPYGCSNGCVDLQSRRPLVISLFGSTVFCFHNCCWALLPVVESEKRGQCCGGRERWRERWASAGGVFER